MRPLSGGHIMSSPGLTRHPELTSTVASLWPCLSVGDLHLMADGTRRCGGQQGLWWKQNIANPSWLEGFPMGCPTLLWLAYL